MCHLCGSFLICSITWGLIRDSDLGLPKNQAKRTLDETLFLTDVMEHFDLKLPNTFQGQC